MRSRTAVGLTVLALLSGFAAGAQERPDSATIWKIRQEATDRSQVLRTVHYLTDVYGPRLTGSPNLKAAGDWAVKQMQAWGLENAHLEPWEWGHPGWQNERLSAHIVMPMKDTLTVEPLAWTPGTNGPVRGQAVQIEVPSRPTSDELTTHLDGLKATVAGKIVLVGKHQFVPVTFYPPALRRDELDLHNQYDPDAQPPPTPGPPPGPGPAARPRDRDPNAPLTPAQLAERVDQFLVAAGALVRVNDAGRDHGQIRAFSNRTYDPTKAVATVVMRNEDFGRISRILADGTAVELEFDIVNRVYPEGKTAYNVIGEIPGTDKRDEVVMLGGHLDSWHAATGATDNAVGVSVMMDVMRVLRAIGVQPRRTIRIALWSGEEQGLLGSQAYVKEHFGTAENPKPDFSKFGGYFNIDSGTGRARGATVFGPGPAADILREALSPFTDLGVIGATTTRSRRRGGSDHTSFNEAGLPGIGMQQDPIQYQSYSWHTNLDTYERVVEEDVKKSVIAIAAAVYHLAMRDELLPRFTEDDMPPAPQPPPAQPSSAAQP